MRGVANLVSKVLVQLLAKNSVRKTFFRGVANLVSKVLVQLLAKNSVKRPSLVLLQIRLVRYPKTV